jgi:glycosyltransferase involved in cell wall biosynthesis|tara:strand:- start:1087 stop:2328 length:1242 start_codon:yes stop_codon:yes gene_type:complete
MKKKILIKAPIHTRSGYGEQSRFALRALRSREDLFDIFIQPIEWGKTSWVCEDTEERRWIDTTIEKTIAFIQHGGQFDVSFQITIPNEWQNIAPVNVGFTAGMETTKVSHQWIQKGNEMNGIVVVSDHSKNTYVNSVYTGVNEQNNQPVELRLETPITTVNYPVKKFENTPELPLDLEFDFNFLVLAQMGPRKNVPNTIKWFIEEFKDEEVGLIVKTNMAKNCLMDREKVFHDLRKFIIEQAPEHKCKVYLLHGDMGDDEIHSLFVHPKIKSLLTLTHGEGFGLPIFEAAYSEMPIIAPGWSGHLDFLVNKKTGKSEFYNVEYDIQPIPEHVLWDGVIIKDSMWAYPREHSAKQKMRECFANFKEAKTTAVKLSKRLHKNLSEENQNAQMVAAVCAAVGMNTEKQEEKMIEFE